MSDLEVKVGQVWVNKVTGHEISVTGVGPYGVSVNDTKGELGDVSVGYLRQDFTLFRDSATQENNTITLRDHLAGLAMQGCVEQFIYEPDDGGVLSRLAKLSYAIADAMIDERG